MNHYAFHYFYSSDDTFDSAPFLRHVFTHFALQLYITTGNIFLIADIRLIFIFNLSSQSLGRKFSSR